MCLKETGFYCTKLK